MPACEQFGASLLPYFPLAGGALTGKYRRGEPAPAGTPARRRQRRRAGSPTPTSRGSRRSTAFASERGRGVGELALAWLASQRVVCSVIAGATRPGAGARQRRRARVAAVARRPARDRRAPREDRLDAAQRGPLKYRGRVVRRIVVARAAARRPAPLRGDPARGSARRPWAPRAATRPGTSTHHEEVTTGGTHVEHAAQVVVLVFVLAAGEGTQEERALRARGEHTDDRLLEPAQLAVSVERDAVALVAVPRERDAVERRPVALRDPILRLSGSVGCSAPAGCHDERRGSSTHRS